MYANSYDDGVPIVKRTKKDYEEALKKLETESKYLDTKEKFTKKRDEIYCRKYKGLAWYKNR